MKYLLIEVAEDESCYGKVVFKSENLELVCTQYGRYTEREPEKEYIISKMLDRQIYDFEIPF